MLYFLFNFFEELILTLFILVGIAVSSFFKRQTHYLTDLFYQKKVFYLFFRCTYLLLLVCLLSNLWIISNFFYLEASVVDSLSLNTFYYQGNNQPFGTTFFRKDLFTVFLNLLLTVITLFFCFLFYETHKVTQGRGQTYYLEVPVILLTIFLALKLFLYAYDLMLIVITLELTAFSTIILLSLPVTTKANIFPFEAAIKYFVFNAIAISLFLFAIGGYYAIYKSINLLDFPLFQLFEPGFCYEQLETVALLQFIFFSAYLLKLGAAPFHQWVPDVYEGAELTMTALLVVLVGPVLNLKAFVFIKLLLPVFDHHYLLFNLFLFCGIVSVIIGSVNAFTQTRIKRFLAYTGISHLGYILISFGTATYLGFFASFFYLFFYITMNIVFFSLLLITRKTTGMTLIFLNHLKILLNDHFLLFVFFVIPLLSFAGFPPFAGFFSKFFLLVAFVDQQNVGFLILLVFYIVLSAYLYLRFIKVAIFEKLQYQVFIPLRTFSGSMINQNTDTYQRLQTTLQPQKNLGRNLSVHNHFLFLVFILNSSLFLVLGFLPTICLVFQQPLLSLFLFY